MVLAKSKKTKQGSYQNHKEKASEWFMHLRNQICEAFEQLEGEDTLMAQELAAGRFEYTPWQRQQDDMPVETDLGGGTMGVMRGGRVFEKVGVNISTVHGQFSEEFREKIPGTDEDPSFWASGISLVAHMRNPFVPSVHMNTRYIVTAGKSWFGGGADLTPTFEFENDNKDFHAAFQAACDAHDPEYYPKYKKWCDDYFFIKHRNEPRGIGGIFYDYLNTEDWEADFAFTQDVGKAFLDIFPQLVRRRMSQNWTDKDKEKQLIKRARYVEFNLVYDRGTKFGLETGGNTDAILMSMPPMAKWP